MNSERRKFNIGIIVLLLAVAASFLFTRPLNSPWHPFIAGDGLGYYSYLPAQFIYNDHDFHFAWFNKAHNDNYIYSTFPNPEDNLLVEFGDRKINKYYQGLSFVWLPFFAVAHTLAEPLGYQPDGFSQPYQVAVGFASLVYLLAGLYFLARLLFRLHGSWKAALFPTAAVFFGTWLFTYGIFANSLSHLYSFAVIVMFCYFISRFFSAEGDRLLHLLLAGLFLVLAVCIRPLTGLIVLIVPAFLPAGFFSGKLNLSRPKLRHLLVVTLALACLLYTLFVTWKQTGSLFAYTYAGETFNFAEARFFDALISYHQGLFVYVPVALLSLAGVPFLSRRQRVMLPLFFFFVIFLYSAWWYWPIVKRALIDFYILPALFLAALIAGLGRRGSNIVCALVLLCIIYSQFKFWQFRKGILDENATHQEVFWRNFLRTEKAHLYPVPPHTIIKSEVYKEDFEGPFQGNITKERYTNGQHSLLLDSAFYICRIASPTYPAIFDTSGFQKIRFSFSSYFEKNVGPMHVFIQFFDRSERVLREVPFYLNPEDISPGKWDHKEFGYEVVDVDSLNAATVSHLAFTIWNVEGKGRIFIDDAKIEFLLTDRSFETIKQ